MLPGFRVLSQGFGQAITKNHVSSLAARRTSCVRVRLLITGASGAAGPGAAGAAPNPIPLASPAPRPRRRIPQRLQTHCHRETSFNTEFGKQGDPVELHTKASELYMCYFPVLLCCLQL